MMNTQRSMIQSKHTRRQYTTCQAPVKSLLKARSQDWTPQQLLTRRHRLCSEPSKTLTEQGFVQCGTIGMDEAWNRFGIRKAKVEPSEPEKNSTSIQWKNQSYSGQPLMSSVPHKIQPPKERANYINQSAINHHMTPQRHQSVLSASSYGSALSWVSSTAPPLPSALTYSTLRVPLKQDPPSQYQYQNNQVIPCLLTKQRTLSNQWTGVKRKQREWQEKLEKVELQSQLGRPTDSIDSPYSICFQMRAIAKSQQVIPSRLPVLQSKTSRQVRMIPAAQLITSIDPKVKSDQRVIMMRGSSLDSLTTAASSVSDTQSSCTTVSAKSVWSRHDEAQRLWKNLEQTLGVDLGCQAIRAADRTRVKQRSQIPRLKVGQSIRPNYNHDTLQSSLSSSVVLPARRPSRLPIASRPSKQNWEPKLKRNSSLLIKTLRALRSADSALNTSIGLFHHETHTNYVGSLGKSERERREVAIQRRNWGEQSLQQIVY